MPINPLARLCDKCDAAYESAYGDAVFNSGWMRMLQDAGAGGDMTKRATPTGEPPIWIRRNPIKDWDALGEVIRMIYKALYLPPHATSIRATLGKEKTSIALEILRQMERRVENLNRERLHRRENPIQTPAKPGNTRLLLCR